MNTSTASCAARAGTPPCIPPSPSALLALASDALWRLAGENGLSDARFGAVVSTYRAAEHLYDLAEALAGGLPLDHLDVVLSLRGAMWRLAEMEGAHGIDVLPEQDKVQMVGASGGPSTAGAASL